MEAIGVIEGNSTDLGGRRGPDALHECEVPRPLGRVLARSVSVLEVLEGETMQLRSAGHCVELLVQRRTAWPSVGIEVADRLPRIDEHDRTLRARASCHP
jgi:hypothetical protein